MRKFHVAVNGVSYEVEIEEVESVSGAAAPAPAAAPKAAPAAPKAAPIVQGTSGKVAVKAPMPGTIVRVSASVGQSVKKGDLLCVLEAMKMENEIFAPADGVIASVNVTKGTSVATDDVIATLN